MAAARPGEGTSLYVHVPFCVVKCGYCDFTSYVVQEESAHDDFLRALDRELALAAPPRHPISVFFGGGTPSLLSEERLRELFTIVGRHVDLAADIEVTMEANPESITAAKVEIARRAGVNRFSMGVQSFDAARLRFLDRAHSADRARDAVAELRRGGAENVSIDLMFALPGQTMAEWDRDLDCALELQPDHLSCYALIFESGTRLTRDLAQGRLEACDEGEERAMFLRTRERLRTAGFTPYEISNFAGRGGPCAHNDHYWLQGDYVGVGPGASSHCRGQRSTNLKALEAWTRTALGGHLPVATAETLSPEQRIGEAIWLGIRRSDGVDLAAIERRIDWPLAPQHRRTLDEMVQRGHLRQHGDNIQLTEEGVLFADSVGTAFLVAGDD